jgi:hypothetical protein
MPFMEANVEVKDARLAAGAFCVYSQPVVPREPLAELDVDRVRVGDRGLLGQVRHDLTGLGLAQQAAVHQVPQGALAGLADELVRVERERAVLVHVPRDPDGAVAVDLRYVAAPRRLGVPTVVVIAATPTGDQCHDEDEPRRDVRPAHLPLLHANPPGFVRARWSPRRAAL